MRVGDLGVLDFLGIGEELEKGEAGGMCHVLACYFVRTRIQTCLKFLPRQDCFLAQLTRVLFQLFTVKRLTPFR